jgi:hypothetical protein
LQRATKLILASLTVVALVAAVIAGSVRHRVEVNLPPDVNPVPQNAATLNGADVEKVLGVEKFRVTRCVKEVPPVVMKSFSNFSQHPFDLANPGEEISSDALIPGRSSRRLVFLAISDDSAVLFYEQGGFYSTFNAVVFWFGSGGHGWGGTLERGPIPHDVSSFREAIQSGNFRPWKGSEG